MGVRQQFKAEERRNAVYVNNFTKQLQRLRRDMMNVVIANMSGSVETLAQNAASWVNESYLPSFYNQMYIGVGGYWARKQYNSLLGLKQDIRDAVWEQQLKLWVEANTGERIISVQGTLKEWVQNTVQRYVDIALENGTGIELITQRVKDFLNFEFVGYQEWKVRQIVANEVLTAYSVSNKIGADSTGLDYTKTWIWSGSKDPHHNHIPLNGKTIGKDELFTVGQYTAKYPRDLTLGPEESIGCKCAIAYRPKR